MNRRRFLAGTGLVGSLGLAVASRVDVERPLSVRVWLSERAAAHDGVGSCVSGYLERALGGALDRVAVAVADRPIALDAEDGAGLMEVDWPRMVIAGAIRSGPVRPTADVNLLVTDGDPSGTPAGYGMHRIATVGGARLLAAMPPAEETPPVVPYSAPAAITQLLLHECGHALGLDHRHGFATIREGVLVASPMVGGYAWADADVKRRHLPWETNRCGEPIQSGVNRRRALSLEYGPCAGRAIRRHRPGVLP